MRGEKGLSDEFHIHLFVQTLVKKKKRRKEGHSFKTQAGRKKKRKAVTITISIHIIIDLYTGKEPILSLKIFFTMK